MRVRFLQGKPNNMTLNLTRRVVCAANKIKATGLIVCGARHYDSVMHPILALTKSSKDGLYCNSDIEQGFINTWGEFLTREEAWLVAWTNDQIIRLVGNQKSEDLGVYGTELYSENLY